MVNHCTPASSNCPSGAHQVLSAHLDRRETEAKMEQMDFRVVQVGNTLAVTIGPVSK